MKVSIGKEVDLKKHEVEDDQVFESRLLEALNRQGDNEELITAVFTGDIGAMDMFEQALWEADDAEDLEDEKYLPIKFQVTGTKWQLYLLRSLIGGGFDGGVDMEIIDEEGI